MATWKIIGRLVMLAAVVVLAGCGTAAPAAAPAAQQPTPDLGMVKTEAAQTVVAGITAEALLNPSPVPSSTPLPPTETPLPPTATPAPTLTAAPTATRSGGSGTGGGGSSGGGGGGGSILPTATAYTDRAAWVSQNLADGVGMKPGQDFDIVWTVKNTGVRDWTTDFYYQYLSGDLKPVKGETRMIGATVAKNDTVALRADFIAPSQPGRYTSNWGIVNDDGVVFFKMYIVIWVQ